VTERKPRRTPARPAERTLTDPRAIKALAHPARLSVLDALSGDVELTATECAAAAGVSPSAMSYHLRALEKWGFVERAENSTDGRERPWRSVPGGWRIEAMPDRAATAATTTITSLMLDRMRVDIAKWFDREREQPSEWRDATTVENRALWLTAEEAEHLRDVYEEATDAYRGRSAADHPDGARRVRLGRVVVPIQLD
jgi:DNA-binding transcriptional ArsR family regulator